MKAKDQQPYMLDDELGSREEVEVHEQRIKELEEYNEQGGGGGSNNKIIIFATMLIFTLTIIFYVIIQANKNSNFKINNG